MSDSFQLSLFDDEPEPAKSLDYIAIDFETANQYGRSAISVGLVRFINAKKVIISMSVFVPLLIILFRNG